MLEILFLIWFCKKLAATARAKNRPGSWGALGAILWICGELGGAALGASNHADGMGLYACALVGAGVGAVIALGIVSAIKPIPRDGDLPIARIV